MTPTNMFFRVQNLCLKVISRLTAHSQLLKYIAMYDRHQSHWTNMIITHYCDICKNRMCFGHERPRCESYCHKCGIY